MAPFGTFRYQITTSLTTPITRRDDLFICQWWQSARISEAKALGSKILIYQNLTRVSAPDGEGRYSTGLTIAQAEALGAKTAQKDEDQGGYIVKPNVGGYPEAWWKAAAKRAREVGADGVFLDDMNVYSDGATESMSEAEWKTQMAACNSIVGAGLRSEGLLAIANMSGATGQRNIESGGWLEEQFAPYDGGLDEFFVLFPNETVQSLSFIESALGILKRQTAAGKYYLAHINGSGTLVTYAFALFLMNMAGSKGRVFFEHEGYGSQDWPASLETGLTFGESLGPTSTTFRTFKTGSARAETGKSLGYVTNRSNGLATLDEDNFSEINTTTRWNKTGTVTAVENKARVETTASYPNLQTKTLYPIQNKAITVEVPTLPANHFSQQTKFGFFLNGENFFLMEKTNGSANLSFEVKQANVTTSVTAVTWNAAEMKWWRVRAQGTKMLFQTSPNGSTWTTRGEAAITLSLSTAMRSEIVAGYFGTPTEEELTRKYAEFAHWSISEELPAAFGFRGGFKREGGKLVIKPEGTGRRREGLVRTSGGSLATHPAGTIARRRNGWPVDSEGRVCTSEGAVAKNRFGLPLDSAGRICISTGTGVKTRFGFLRDSSNKLVIVEGS